MPSATELFLQLAPGDPDAAEEVLLAAIEETGEVDPDLLRTLARMQDDPEAFLVRIDALMAELDADDAQVD